MANPIASEMAQLALKTTVPAPPKLDKGKKGKATKVVTNSFPVTISPNTPFYLHDLRIHAVYQRNGEEKLKEITKQTRDDYIEQDRKSAAIQAYHALKANNMLQTTCFYDRAALLITLKEIPGCKGGAEYKCSLTPQNAPHLFALDTVKEASEVRVTIKKASETYQVTSNDISSTDDATRRALLNVVNLATSQHLLEADTEFVVYGNGNAYLLQPGAHGFEEFGVGTRDKYGGVGLTKGARLVEGPGGKQAAAITVDTKKTAFHRDLQPVYNKLSDCGCLDNSAEATQVLTGLKALVFYAGAPANQQRARMITIGSASSMKVRDAVVDTAQGRTLLSRYINDKYHTQIRYPNAPCIVERYDGHLYAPECLLIAPNQRVKNENVQSSNIEALIRVSATLPVRRQAETRTLAQCMDAGTNNAAQVARGVTVNTAAPIVVDGRVQDAVKIGTGAGAPVAVNGPWRQSRIAQVPLNRFTRWTVLYIHDSREVKELAKNTANALIRYANGIGYAVNMGLSTAHELLQRDQEAQMDALIRREKTGGSQFILVIAHKFIKNHAMLKMMEVRHDVVVQQITSDVAGKVCATGGANTATNVCLKVVEKLGGQNHFISRLTSDLPAWVTLRETMLIGLQLDHPSSLSGKERDAGTLPSRPVCIGWCTNAVKGAAEKEQGKSTADVTAINERESTHFSAGWGYCMPKDFKDGVDFRAGYKDSVMAIMRTFRKYRGVVPQRIVLFRGGVPEGDYEKIRREEVPIWEEVFFSLNQAYKPNFVIISVNEMHSDRFYAERINPADKAPKQNLAPGTVISSGVTNPAISSSFIQCHMPLQGTAKVPLFVCQHITARAFTFTMDDMERLCYALAYSHGVCNTPTAIPTPLYVAQESMKRSVELLNYWQRGNSRAWNLDEIRTNLTISPEAFIHGLRVNA